MIPWELEDARRWSAVAQHDRPAADGAFVLALMTMVETCGQVTYDHRQRSMLLDLVRDLSNSSG